jgi:hypothetical protein
MTKTRAPKLTTHDSDEEEEEDDESEADDEYHNEDDDNDFEGVDTMIQGNSTINP